MLLTGVPAKTDAMGKKPGKDWKVGLSQGNGYRQLQAPLIFFAKKTINVDATPLATAIGLFDGDPASPGATGPHADGSAQSLLITFPPHDTCDPDIASIGAHGELLLARFDADGQPHLTRIIKSVGADESLIRPRVGDLDGDGIPDVAALKVKFDLNLGQLVETQVVVLRGDGKGSFEAPLTVPIAGIPVDLALVNASGDAGLELVVVSAYANPVDLSAELFVLEWDKAATDATKPFFTLLPRSSDTTADSSGGSVLDRPTALAGGDFDGDGVDDVAVAIAGGIRMFKGVAR